MGQESIVCFGGGGVILVAEWDSGMGATNKKQNRKSTDKFIG